MHLTVAYVTNRKNPRIEWFFQSLSKEVGKGDPDNPVRVLVIDSHMTDQERQIDFLLKAATAETISSIKHIPPKPCVWQGPHRLTKEDWFAASNARNTALCYAPDGYIAYVDDLSVLMPGWFSCVREAMQQNKIICGTYRKVKNLKIENGVALSWDESESGMDTRAKYAPTNPWPCDGGWLYGCSCAMPVEALLMINGWPEICDSLGSEDSCCGIALHNSGYQLIYDQRMLTLEDHDAHFEDKPLLKENWHFENGIAVKGGNVKGDGKKDDKSWAVLNIALQSKHFPNYCDIRRLRQSTLNGVQFPIAQIPEHDFYTGIALRDL